MLEKAGEAILFQLARFLYRRNAGQSDEMTAALKDAGSYQQYRADCTNQIAEAAEKYGVRIAGRDVLDLGCYDGAVSHGLLSLQPKSVAATDIDEVAIASARQKYDGEPVEFVVNTATRIPINDQSVDTIVSYDVFEHIEDPDLTLKECWRVLRPGGQMLIGTWGWYHPFAPHLWSVMPVPWAHVFFSERTMLRVCRRIYRSDWYVPNMHDFDAAGERIPDKFNYDSIPADYLNKFLVRDFENLFARSGFDFCITPERFSTRWAAWTTPLLRVPFLREFCTAYIWCVLTKPATAEKVNSRENSGRRLQPVG